MKKFLVIFAFFCAVMLTSCGESAKTIYGPGSETNDTETGDIDTDDTEANDVETNDVETGDGDVETNDVETTGDADADDVEAKEGDGNLVEVMSCEGGCVAGPCVVQNINLANVQLDKYVKEGK